MGAEDDLPPQITGSEGALAHEKAGYSKRVDIQGDSDSGLAADNDELWGNDGDNGPNLIPHVPGINASEGDTPYVETEGPGIVKEEDDAEIDAHAGDEPRSHAANARRLAKATEDFPAKHSSATTPEEKQELENELNSLANRQHELAYPTSRFIENARKSGHDEVSKKAHEATIERLREFAAERDERAKRIEELSALLRKSPPSEAYLKANPLPFEYDTPAGLWIIEYIELPDIEEYLKSLAEDSSEAPKSYKEAGALIEEFKEAGTINGSAPDEPWSPAGLKIKDEILSAAEQDELDKMTGLQIRELAGKILNFELLTLDVDVRYMRRILQEVTSGKAADPNYQPEKNEGAAEAESPEQPYYENAFEPS